MKVLLCNKFYYRRGGDCVYTINLEKMLVERGHEVAVFAMDCADSIQTPWREYFAPEVCFDGIWAKVKYAARCLGIGEVRTKFTKLLDAFQPDVVHLNNIHSQLSPVIAFIAHSRGLKVVWTLHDYKLLCPRYDCMQGGERQCDECFKNKIGVLKHSCMKNSFAASGVALAEAVKWNRSTLEYITDVFICPSVFMKSQMMKGGFDSRKLHHICNSIDIRQCQLDDYSKREDYYCYVGRLSPEKGVSTLARVAATLPYRLLVIGDGPLAGSLPVTDNIEYLGKKNWPELKKIVGAARFMVMPSECYDNNPLSVIEALCLGTPVLGAEIGGIPELISSGVNGMTFKSGDSAALADGIKIMFESKFYYASIAKESQSLFSEEEYYKRLMDLYCSPQQYK